MKTAFLVLGAQRSGTSVASHVLSRFGVNFGDPQHFLQDHHNPIFFELSWVNQFNNRIIQALGHQYTDFFLPVESDFNGIDTAPIEQEIQQQLELEWSDSSLIGIKDPRISLTFPIWEKLLLQHQYQPQILIALRSPSGFLQSNQKLFHNWEGWTAERHLKFWLQLNLAAVYFTRHYSVCYVDYDALMMNPQQTVKQLALQFQLDLQLTDRAARVIDRAYYHHAASTTGFEWVDRFYQQLCSQTLSATDYLDYRQRLLTHSDASTLQSL